MKTEINKDELFAIVPQILTATHKFNNGEFRVLVACLGIDNIKKEDGTSFTVSVGSLSKMTGISEKQVRRIVEKLVKLKILVGCGRLKYEKGRINTTFPIYRFDYDKLIGFIVIKDKMSIGIINDNEAQNDIGQSSRDILSDKVSDKVSDKSHSRSNNPVKVTSIKEITIEGQIPETLESKLLEKDPVETLFGKIKEKKNSESPESKEKEEQEFQDIRAKLFDQLKQEDIKRVNISGYAPSDQTIWNKVNLKLKLGYKNLKH